MCMQIKKQHLEHDMEKQTEFNWERSMSRLCIVICLLNLYAEYVMWNAELESRFQGEKYADDITFMAEIEEELNNHLIKVKGKCEKLA